LDCIIGQTRAPKHTKLPSMSAETWMDVIQASKPELFSWMAAVVGSDGLLPQVSN